MEASAQSGCVAGSPSQASWGPQPVTLSSQWSPLPGTLGCQAEQREKTMPTCWGNSLMCLGMLQCKQKSGHRSQPAHSKAGQHPQQLVETTPDMPAKFHYALHFRASLIYPSPAPPSCPALAPASTNSLAHRPFPLQEPVHYPLLLALPSTKCPASSSVDSHLQAKLSCVWLES